MATSCCIRSLWHGGRHRLKGLTFVTFSKLSDRLFSIMAGRIQVARAQSPTWRCCHGFVMNATNENDNFIPVIDVVAPVTSIPNQPESPKILKVAIIGEANAGKSTLTNALVGRKVVPVCHRPQTTRERTSVILTRDNMQVVLLDSPGVVSRKVGRKFQLSRSLVTGARDCVLEADLIAVMVDAANKYTRDSLSKEIIDILKDFPSIPSVLILNKVDAIRKELLLQLIDKLTDQHHSNEEVVHYKPQIKRVADRKSYIIVDESIKNVKSNLMQKTTEPENSWSNFMDVFMISALRNDGIERMRDYLFSQAKPGNWLFEANQLATMSPSKFVEEVIREKMLELLPHDLPYILKQTNLFWHRSENGCLRIQQAIDCKRNGQMSILIGPEGKVIRKINETAREELERAFNCPVELVIRARLKK